MGLVVSVVIFILAFLSYLKRRKWYAPEFFFLIMWGIITLLSHLHLYGMYETSDVTFLIILIGCISYKFGSDIGYKLKIYNDYTLHRTEFVFSLRFFWIAVIILFLLKLSPFLKAYALVGSGVDLAEIRSDYFEQSKSSLDVIIDVITSLLGPIVQISGIVYFIQNFKKNFGCLLVIMVLALMNSVINGGRFGIAHILIEFVVCYFFLRQNTRKRIKVNKVMLYSFAFVSVFVLFEITLMRGIESGNVNGHYYAYLCGCVKYFDLQLKILDSSTIYPFGFALWGLWYNLFRFLHVFGIPYPDWYLYIGNNMSTTEIFLIGEDMRVNAFCTPFYHLYYDMGWVGVIIGMYILGLFASYVYKRALKCPNTPNVVFYLIVIQMLFMTVFSYPFVNNGYVLIVLYMLFTKRLSFH